MKNILLISGSNRNGNTNYLLKKIQEKVNNSEIILLNEYNIEYCKGCLACHKIDKCIINDDMKEIINKIVNADLIIFGIPNYFDNVTGLFKNFMDRLHPLYKSESIKNKKIIFIFIGGGKEEGTKEEMNKSVKGLVKYLKLKVIRDYSYKALKVNDVEEQNEKINSMLNDIINVIDGN